MRFTQATTISCGQGTSPMVTRVTGESSFKRRTSCVIYEGVRFGTGRPANGQKNSFWRNKLTDLIESKETVQRNLENRLTVLRTSGGFSQCHNLSWST